MRRVTLPDNIVDRIDVVCSAGPLGLKLQCDADGVIRVRSIQKKEDGALDGAASAAVPTHSSCRRCGPGRSRRRGRRRCTCGDQWPNGGVFVVQAGSAVHSRRTAPLRPAFRQSALARAA